MFLKEFLRNFTRNIPAIFPQRIRWEIHRGILRRNVGEIYGEFFAWITETCDARISEEIRTVFSGWFSIEIYTHIPAAIFIWPFEAIHEQVSGGVLEKFPLHSFCIFHAFFHEETLD